jgi:hypothetical protein
MRRLKQILLAIASTLAAAAAPTGADVDAVRDFVARNRAYTPAERTEALGEVGRLPDLIGDPARFELAAAHIAALADNGHSVLLPTQWPLRYPRSPVHLGLFADGLYVIAAPAPYAALLHRRVIAIDGHPWQEVRRAYAAYQGGTQPFRDQFVTLFMETPALLVAAGLGTESDALRLTLDTGPVSIPARLDPPQGEAAFTGRSPLIDGAASLPRLPLYLENSDTASRFVFLPEIDAAYVHLKEIRGLRFDAFLAATLTELRARHPRHIIVDLRFNMGGDLNLARDFMAALPGIARGQLYAITSGRTFSAAIASLGYLKQAAGARLTIVGEPIGDRLEFWSEGNFIRLPGLGAAMLYASERHNYTTGCPEADCHAAIRLHPIRVRSLAPDLPTPLTFADYAAGRDPAMDAIAADIRRR